MKDNGQRKDDKGLIELSVAEENDVLSWLSGNRKVSVAYVLGLFFLVVAAAFSLYHLYTGFFGQPEAHLHRSIHLTLVLVMILIMYPADRKPWNSAWRWTRSVDFLLIGLSLATEIYFLMDREGFRYRVAAPNTMDMIVGGIVYFLVLEGTRRTVGWPMVIVALFFSVHALFADHFISILYGSPTFLDTFISETSMSEGGILGIPIGVMSSFVVLFLIFSAILIYTGAGKFFVNLAYALTGTKVGGPAKAAIISSMAFGTISGSTASDVVATGSFTIPLMRRLGYRKEFAGGVEAVASSGGAFMPPVMGAVAFIMSAFLGVPYFQVAIAALLPAVLYYFSLFLMVDFQARKRGLAAISKEGLPTVGATMRWGAHLVLPVVVLVVMLALNYTASAAAAWSIVILLAVTMVKRESRLNPRKAIKIFESVGKRVLPVSAACACAGIIISATTLSGAGLRLGQAIVSVSGHSLLLALLFTMLFSIILGMGLSTTAVYITLVVTIIPILTRIGIVPIGAHLFALYFGVLSNIIPPVAIATFAAAAVAESNPMRTAITAFGIGIAGLIVPFVFVYKPELLLTGKPLAIASSFIVSAVGIVGLAASLRGWMRNRVSPIWRVVLLAAALSTVSTSPYFFLPGAAAILAYVVLFQRKESLAAKRAAQP